jgi:hypothetical protein
MTRGTARYEPTTRTCPEDALRIASAKGGSNARNASGVCSAMRKTITLIERPAIFCWKSGSDQV